MSVIILPKVNPLEFEKIYELFCDITFPMASDKPNQSGARSGFPKHRKLIFGVTRKRGKDYVGLSRDSILHEEAFNELSRIGDLIVPFEYTTMHINENVVCPPHKDRLNDCESVIVSFGDYSGCNLIVEGIKYDTYCQPIMFDGSKLLHWNTNDLQGQKYSVVFYKQKF